MRTRIRIPWPVWVAVVPAVLIGLNELRKGGRERVEVVGAGHVSTLVFEDAPRNARYALELRARESIAETARRAEAKLNHQTYVLVLGFDETEIEAAPEDAKVQLAELVRKSEIMVPVTVLVGTHDPSSLSDYHVWWRSTLCRARERVMCVEAPPGVRLGPAIQPTVRDAIGRLGSIRLQSQRSR